MGYRYLKENILSYKAFTFLFVISLMFNIFLMVYNFLHEYSYFSYILQETNCIELKQHNLSDYEDDDGNESASQDRHRKKYEKSEASQLLNWVSSVMAIIATGITLFALFGGFLSLINMNMSKDLQEAISKAHQFLKDQEELTTNRYLQEGRNYYVQRKMPYAKDAYMQAICHGGNTFSSLLAKYEIGILYADVLDLDVVAADEALKWFKKAEDDLENHLGSIEYYNLLGDIWFSRGCCYGVFANRIKESKCKEKYLKESADCFRKAIKVGIHKVDYYKNLSATCESLGQYDKCKEYLEKAYHEAKNDVLDKYLLTTDRLYPLFGIEIDDKTKKVIPAGKQDMKDIIDELYAKYNSSNN